MMTGTNQKMRLGQMTQLGIQVTKLPRFQIATIDIMASDTPSSKAAPQTADQRRTLLFMRANAIQKTPDIQLQWKTLEMKRLR